MKSYLAAAVAAALSLAWATAPATAQSYPTRPVTLIVPLGAGGSTDVIGRIVADGMSKALGQAVVVENVAGAGGTVGIGRVVRSPADGYTIQIGQWGTNVAAGAIYNQPFNLLTDLEPIGLIATQPFLVVARKTMPATNLKELLDWLKANPDKATQGHAGVGSPGHVSGIFLQRASGLTWAMVAYKSAGPALQDVIAGNIDIALDTPATSRSYIESGLIKAYAVTSKTRIAAFPDLPTVAEAGVPGYEFSFWHALWAAKGTPKDVLDRLNAALIATLEDKAIREKLVGLSQDIFPRDQQTPQALRTFQTAEIETWWPVIKAAGISSK